MNKFYVGVDYYPEQWSEDRWATDAKLMQEAGFNLVRLAEFAWVKLEPELGKFDFTWLDRAIAILSAHGLEVVLCTPTASPPAWLMSSDPTLFRVMPSGQAVTFGHRRGYCPHHLGYRQHAKRIVTALTAHYANCPDVIGWQIDNEFGDRSYSSAAQTAFQNWLEQKYTSLNALEAAWGTIFWSQTYTTWSQIPLPLETGASHNPGLALDFARFSSDGYVSFQAEQIKLIRAACPAHFITHNLMGFGYDQLDYFDLAKELDFVSWDNYPRIWWNIQANDDSSRAALGHSTIRGLKQQNFWVMEQQAGAGGWEMVVPHPRPGELRLWAYQAIAHGADGIVFFRFRTARFGTEQYWHGLLEHDGTTGRRYQEAKKFGLELQQIGSQILASKIEATVALLQDYDSRFALQIQPNNPNLSYTEQFGYWYSALHRRNISTDVISTQADLSPYKIIIAPLLHLVTPEITAKLEQFVENGGTLVLTARSGVKDNSNAIVNQALPGLLQPLAGVKVVEYDSLYQNSNAIRWTDAQLPDISISLWCDVLELTSASAIAHYTQDHYAQSVAISRNLVGKGQVIYVGALGDAALPKALLAGLLESTSHAEIEITERHKDGHCLRFYLNHSPKPHSIKLEQPARSILTGKTYDILYLEPYGVEILQTD